MPKFLRGLLASILLVFIFLYSPIFNLDKPIEFARGDTFHVIFTLKHYLNIFFSGQFNEILTVPMFYGFKNSLLFSELFIFPAAIALPIYFIFKNIILTFNLISILTMIFSFLSMFLLVQYLTKNFFASILAAIIYVFNPFVIGHFPDNLHYYSLQWLPLIFLFFEKSLKSHLSKNLFWLFLILTLQLLTTLTFGALLTVILPIYVLVRLWQEKISPLKLLKPGLFIGFSIFALTTLGLGFLYTNYYDQNPINRNLSETAMFSPWVSDLFFTSPNNLIYGGIREKALQAFPDFVFSNPEYVERNLFWGVTPLILFLASFFVLRKSSFKKLWLVLVVMVFLTALLSFGPHIRFTTSFSLPGIYGLVHRFNPLLQNLRVASRFSIFTFLFLGQVAGLTLAKISQKLTSKKALILSLSLITLVTLEYSSRPWRYQAIPENIKSFYAVLENQNDLKVILELPMGNLFSRIGLAHNQFVETSYMLYASTLHSKKLLNGYSSYTPPAYARRIEYLTVNFPTLAKLRQLKTWGVEAICLHKDEFYTQSEYDRIKKELEDLDLPKLTEQEKLVAFSLKN